MWLVGMAGIIVASGLVVLPLGWNRRPDTYPPIWDVMRISALYAPICNTLAGFSVASAVFLANLTATRHSDEFGAVMGLFLVAFMAYIGAALIFASIPRVSDGNLSDGGLRSQHITLILGNEALYVAMAPFCIASWASHYAPIWSSRSAASVLLSRIAAGSPSSHRRCGRRRRTAYPCSRPCS